jgi:UrcA family protein
MRRRNDEAANPYKPSTNQETTMSTNTKSRHFRGMISGAMFGVITLSFAAASPAADTEVFQSTVKYQELGTTGTAGAAILYSRIRSAAAAVCQPLDGRDLASKRLAGECVQRAIADAVTKVNHPALFAVYNAKTAAPKPMLLASSQVR